MRFFWNFRYINKQYYELLKASTFTLETSFLDIQNCSLQRWKSISKYYLKMSLASNKIKFGMMGSKGIKLPDIQVSTIILYTCSKSNLCTLLLWQRHHYRIHYSLYSPLNLKFPGKRTVLIVWIKTQQFWELKKFRLFCLKIAKFSFRWG